MPATIPVCGTDRLSKRPAVPKPRTRNYTLGACGPLPQSSRIPRGAPPGNAHTALGIVQQLQVPAGLQAEPQEARRGEVTLSKIRATMIIDTDLMIIKHVLDKSTPIPILTEKLSIARRNM